jgi:ABC-type lipoprotein release transport system permease subunit
MLIEQAQFVRAVLGMRIARFRQARGHRDAGASAIELAIITAILVGLAVAVLIVVTNIVNNRSTEINTNNGKIP